MKAGLENVLRSIADRVRGIYSRALVTRVDASSEGRLQGLQVQVGASVHDRVQHAQQYGFASVPLPGAEAHVIFPGGSRETGVALVVDDRVDRPALEPGESALYNRVAGTEIRMRSTGEVFVLGDVRVQGEVLAGENVRVQGELIAEADVRVQGEVRADGAILGIGGVFDSVGSLEVLRTLFQTHTHPTSDGPTGPPITGAATASATAPPEQSEGQDGADGKSAYALALDAGFAGDVEAWLESLVGQQGLPGADGEDGEGAAPTWTEYATRWDSAPVLLGAISGGDVYEYTLDAVTRYRYVPTTYDAALDAFWAEYVGGVLTTQLATRGS